MIRVHARTAATAVRVSLCALALSGATLTAGAQESVSQRAPLAAWPEPVGAAPIRARAPQAIATRRVTTEQVATEQVVTERVATEQVATEHVATEHVVTEHVARQAIAPRHLPLTLAPAALVAIGAPSIAPSGVPLPRLHRADGWKLGGLAAAALLVATADRRGDVWARRRDVIDSDIWQAVGQVGDVTGALGSIGIGPAAWLLGRVRGDSGTAVLGLRTTEAVVASGVMIVAIKAIAGRTRPYASADNSPTHWDLFGGRRSDSTRSFASGHSALAAAAAVTLAAEWRRQGRQGWSSVGPPLVYALASVVGAARIVDRQHWLSDVAAGAGVGILNALLVRRWHDAHPGSRLDRTFLRRSR